MALALVTMPYRWASTIPRFTPVLRPKSSAFTMRMRSSLAVMVRLSASGEALRQFQRLGKPIVLVLPGRRPLAGPTEPLHRDLQATRQQVTGIGAGIRGDDRVALRITPTPGDQRGQVHQARADRGELPVDRTDARDRATSIITRD